MADAFPKNSLFDDADDILIVSSSGSRKLVKGDAIIDMSPATDSVPIPETLASAPEPLAPVAAPAPEPLWTPAPPPAPPVDEPAPAVISVTPLAPVAISAPAAVQPLTASNPSPDEPSITVPPPVADDWESMADQAVTEASLQLSDDLRRRFRLMASMFFRDLRDELETVSKMTMPVTAGGMGFSDAEADRVMAILHARNADHQRGLEAAASAAKRDLVASQADRHLREDARRDVAERASLDELYQRVTDRVAMPEAIAGHSSTSSPRLIRVTDEGAPSGAQDGTIADQAFVAAPSEAMVVESVLTAAARPTVMDVSAAPRLIGPVEELRALRVVDFRRLSKDPHEACLKIRDKIDLLAERSFAERDRGVKAWQDSEVNRLYLDMLRVSLDGKPVVDVISQREFDGNPTLTKPEFDAIMELNRRLRFS